MSENDMNVRLTLNVKRSPEVAVVQLKGELAAGVTDLLYRQVKELIPEVARIVLDLKELTYLDSSGIGMIVRLFVSAKWQNALFNLRMLADGCGSCWGLQTFYRFCRSSGKTISGCRTTSAHLRK